MLSLTPLSDLTLTHPALYIVATPIGHLSDITLRALQVLAKVDVICAEDTRHSSHLLKNYGIETTMIALHEHNELQSLEKITQYLDDNKAIALISDAGTPLIHDPGYKLVRHLRQQNYPIFAVPGPSSVTAALSIAGLPTDRFTFIGFLPTKTASRQTALHSVKNAKETLIFFEAPHRILECIEDCSVVFGRERVAALVKEITKPFERVCYGTFDEIKAWLTQKPEHQKGEFVLLVHGHGRENDDEQQEKMHELLQLLLQELPLKTAAKIVSQHLKLPKNRVYEYALTL